MAKIYGDDGDNVLRSGDQDYNENDEIYGEGGNDTLYAGAGQDILDGGDGDDYLYGGTFIATLIGGGGNDYYGGGTGEDIADFRYAHTGVTVDLRLTGPQDTGEGLDTFVSIERVNGSAHNDVIAAANISGGAGDDVLTGTSALRGTKLSGGDGNDILTGRAWTINGGDGNDIIIISGGAHTIHGGAGVDTLDVSASDESVDIDLQGDQADIGQRVYLDSLENVIGTAHADRLTGSDRNNRLEGGADADRISGGAGNDVITGGTGNDTLDGGDGIDWVIYAEATAAITVDMRITTAQQIGGDDAETISGFENIIGSAFNDIITGTDGDNIIEGGAGSDEIYGGNGNDTAAYNHAAGGVTADLGASSATEAGGGSDFLVSIENLTGSAFADVLVGSNGAGNVLDGGGGSDILWGLDGDDVLIGGAGNDTIDGGNGRDTLSFAAAKKGIKVDLSRSDAQGTNEGTDLISGVENAIGSAYADVITGSNVGNQLEGGAGNDRINGGKGGDRLYGGAGNDILSGGTGTDIIDGGDGLDVVSFAATAQGIKVDLRKTVSQGTNEGNDTLVSIEGVTGSAFDDRIVGNSGANLLTGGAGRNRVDGGGGIDTVTFAEAGVGVTVNLNRQGHQQTGVGNDQILNIENILGSRFGDILIGDGGVNRIEGGAGDDQLYGGKGDDILLGGTGTDTLDGGAGNDTVTFAHLGEGVEISLLRKTQVTSEGVVKLIDVESVVGTAFADQLTGNGRANVFDGGAGADRLDGGAGNDVLRGGLGDDVISGGQGNDILDGGFNPADDNTGSPREIDTLSFADSQQGITLDLRITTAQNTGEGWDTITGFENVIGSAFNDVIIGLSQEEPDPDQAKNNVIYGGGGDDHITGGRGRDILSGGEGNDYLDGGENKISSDKVTFADAKGGITVDFRITTAQNTGEGWDTIVNIGGIIGSDFADVITTATGAQNYAGSRVDAGGGDDIVYVTWSGIFAGGAGTDTLSYEKADKIFGTDLRDTQGFENLIASRFDDTAVGNSGDNRVDGGAGNDKVYGLEGNDVLIGGAGNDMLYGGAGMDTFVATKATGVINGNDTISDFSLSDGDRLDISAYTHGTANTAMISQFGYDTRVTLGDGSVITLTGVNSADPDFAAHIIW